MDHCIKCGKLLTADEIALHKKLCNRGATEFMCLPCLSAYFEVSERLLEEKIRQFKQMGCILFKQ